MALAAGTLLGPYEIQAPIGAGGMGEVYRARDRRLGREVALKLLPESARCDTQLLERFLREAQAASALSHPHICTVHDIGDHDGRRFIVMELLSGTTLQERLQSGPLPFAELCTLAAEIADALAAAHAHAIVHRDIKPGNIFLTAHGVKVLDFGLAKLTGDRIAPEELDAGFRNAETVLPGSGATELTSPGFALGTLFYMSPEQALGKRVDPRSDLFSLGAVLHEMATGRRAFPGATPAAVFDAILHREPDGALPEACAELAPIVQQLLAKEPERRFASAQEVATALRRLVHSGDTSTTRRREAARAEPASIAVLPFLNLSADPENEYFTDGITEEILTALSKIKALRVASRTSSFAFKGRSEDVRAIGRTLGVGSVLEGSVRRSGNRLRVSVQLVQAGDGYQLWSERFDRELADIFAVQDEIAERVVAALRVVLSESERRDLRRIPTDNVEAYDAYLRGRDLLRPLDVKSFHAARKMFERAVALDESFVPAWLGLVESCYWLHVWVARNEELLATARAAAARALVIASDLAEAHVAQGLACVMAGENAGAHRSLARAAELDPRNFDAYYYAARVWVSEGGLEEAAALFATAAEVRPDDYQALTLLAGCYKGLGRADEQRATAARALAVIERQLELQPNDVRAIYFAAGNTLAATGEREAALGWARRALAADPDSVSVIYNIACFYANLGLIDDALDLLERYVSQGWGQREWIEHDPDWEELRDHPRFRAIVARMPARSGN